MSSTYGRPAHSVSTPTLGNSVQRSQAQAMKQVQASTRQRNIYTILSGGAANRLLLSLRCGIPQDVDYALDLLVQFSYTDAQYVMLEYLPGMVGVLLDLAHQATPAAELNSSNSSYNDGEQVRRGTEAALILRNLVIEGAPKTVEAVRPYVGYLFDVLADAITPVDATLHPARHADGLVELQLYLLDIADAYAASYVLAPAALALASRNIAVLPTPAKLYTLLANLAAETNDRAMLIGIYTLLASFALNQQNHPVFALEASSSSAKPSQDDPSTTLLARALSLLQVRDSDLLLPVLEYVYQYTALPSNAAQFLQQSGLRAIVRTVAGQTREGSRVESWEYEVTSLPLAGNHRGQAMRDALIAAYPSLGPVKRPASPPPIPVDPDNAGMSAEAVQHIVRLPEKERVHRWMQAVYEARDDGEIPQVSLWKAYQRQFEGFDAQIQMGEIPKMLEAPDVIKAATEVFHNAMPKQLGEPPALRFVVSGIAPKPLKVEPDRKPKPNELWRCKWAQCELVSPLSDATELYAHLQQAHLQGLAAGPQDCLFGNGKCGYQCTSARQLEYHLRTHIPRFKPAEPDAPAALALAADALDKAKVFFEEKRHTPQTQSIAGQGEYAAGIGFMASLIVRNCARATATAAQRYRKRLAGAAGMQLDSSSAAAASSAATDTGSGQQKNAALDDEEDDVARRKMFGFLTGSTVEDGSAPSETTVDQSKEVILTDTQLREAVTAVVGVETELVALAAANSALAPYLIDALESIRETKSAVNGLL